MRQYASLSTFIAAAFISFVGLHTGASARETVSIEPTYEAGTIVIRTSERRLYLVLGNGTATLPRCRRQARQAVVWPRCRRRQVSLARLDTASRHAPKLQSRAVIPGGSPANPMGAAALTLVGDRYAIHGTNRPSSIGTFASAGCVRMLNADVLDLFDRVSVGTPVLVVR